MDPNDDVAEVGRYSGTRVGGFGWLMVLVIVARVQSHSFGPVCASLLCFSLPRCDSSYYVRVLRKGCLSCRLVSISTFLGDDVCLHSVHVMEFPFRCPSSAEALSILKVGACTFCCTHLQTLWSGLQNSRILELCCCQTCGSSRPCELQQKVRSVDQGQIVGRFFEVNRCSSLRWLCASSCSPIFTASPRTRSPS